MPGLDAIYDAYSFRAIPEIGRLVTGDRDSYQYLVESIRKFPDRDAFSKLMRDAGFSRVQATPMSGGIVALHSGWKL
jgi:demethylmenaquinone methyltransferase/2-methoxy-6-polyprenyl-1,4-benzoquinol methylase